MYRQPLLEINNFKVSFTQYSRGMKRQNLEVIHDISISIAEGDILAIIGASGSGKSLLAHGIMGILPKNAVVEGSMIFKGEILDQKRKQKVRGKEISLIPQSVNYLDPMKKAVKQIDKDKKKSQKLLSQFDLEKKTEKKYPFQLSGGMARRILISTAIASGAKLVIADEPTPGMHESVIEETLHAFRRMADDGNSLIMITHDIELAFKIADKIAVFCEGRVISIEDTENFIYHPNRLNHPYSRAFWHALPQNGFYVEDGKNYNEDIEDSNETIKAIKKYLEGESHGA